MAKRTVHVPGGPGTIAQTRAAFRAVFGVDAPAGMTQYRMWGLLVAELGIAAAKKKILEKGVDRPAA